jgi:MoxR-like ATPase
LVHGRHFVVPDDVKQLAVAVLAHRVITKSFAYGAERQAVEALIARLVNELPVPS